MSFLLPSSQALPGKHACVWLITRCMWLDSYPHTHTHMVIFRVIPFQTCIKLFLDGRARRGKASVFPVPVHAWLDGVYSVDSVWGRVNESVFFSPAGPPFDEGWVIRKETPRKTGSWVIHTFTHARVCVRVRADLSPSLHSINLYTSHFSTRCFWMHMTVVFLGV